MIIRVTAKPKASTGILTLNGQRYPCALGRSGIILSSEKQEGDGATPAGTWILRRLLYREDRMSRPKTNLPTDVILKLDGWCDAPDDTNYNTQIKLPYDASAETLWRDDNLYNLIVVLGHNDNPVIAGKGSAIFFHVAKYNDTGLAPTEGCIALPEATLKALLESCSTDTKMEITIQA